MMTFDLILAFCGFAFISSITPGPNNLMLMTSGMNFGFTRSIPHLLGIGFGFMFLLLVVGFGLGAIFNHYHIAGVALKIISTAYLLYLAWKIANTKAEIKNDDDNTPISKPFSFIQASLFQWINPKAWVMCITAISTYTQSHSIINVVIIAIVFGVIMTPSIAVWLMSGIQLKKILDHPRKVCVFNISAAMLLVGSLIPTLL